MSNVFAGQDPAEYKTINRSVRIGGHSTSIQLESAYWDFLDKYAASRGLSTAKLVSSVYDDAVHMRGKIPNFASVLRTSCLLYLNRAKSDATPPKVLQS